jgi:hypothetical protein
MKRHVVGRGSRKKKKLYTERVRLKGGYTSSGQYFGQGAPLFRVSDENGNQTYVRAASSAIAKVTGLPEIERQDKHGSYREFESKYPGGSHGDFEEWYAAGKR